jgi:hypothetical protein
MKVSVTNRERTHTLHSSPFIHSIISLHSFSVCIRRLTFDPYVKRFVRGAARPRVSFKENLVEEYGGKKTGEDNASLVSSLSMPLSPASVLASLLGGGGDGLSSRTSSKSSDGLHYKYKQDAFNNLSFNARFRGCIISK